MSNADVLYVKGMHLSESEEDYEESDVWDDRKLNEAYDKAVNIANAEIAKRIAMSTNNRQKKSDQHKLKKNSSLKNKKGESTEWKPGMPCRAVYEEDGLEYEAFVLRIINDNECIVRFLGYENSEIVSISTLKPSKGDKTREQQVQDALVAYTEDDDFTGDVNNINKNTEMDCDTDRPGSAVSHERINRKKKKSPKKKNKFSTENPLGLSSLPAPFPGMTGNLHNLNLSSLELPIPPPPLALQSKRDENEDQALHSMLLSWYMSGYYTGLYEGLKRAKNSPRNN